ncbi:MAG: AbrB/MazE/SpoVT family DNA-binding domain-containing protein [Paludibacterium sp.]|uniref:AbrB/MazE/SpoVT family DNA-binding domain-containing protein n=1 Tax=Paludibacterium sp. TaxID=1917523 RepID=UPI0025DD0E2C|nr:AbrB/MazE/SpoVT family DNA-binding domain-containing protein [Paludibacterium sp.]MBV8049126.1 AbrB/MazE/SpoVT family DNA-binding domain-containing protein [Paludibacterium sp.]MBV8649044.1 AbrB/MazE/SpoVT family DNA-binding domain-containing protein [Paludibacterium sp.]
MARATLCRSDGSLIITIPSLYAEQNHLSAGDYVAVIIEDTRMTVEPKCRIRKRYDIEALLAETPEEFLRLPEWEDMPLTGKETG